MIPEISNINEAQSFAQKHNDILLLKAQELFNGAQSIIEYHQGSVLMMGLALHLAHSLGVNKKAIMEHWILIAKSHGAQE
jgi:hypothetical protein